jgi:dimethylamine/trimethylamine dehydrogenase
MEQHFIQSRLLKLGVEIIVNHKLLRINDDTVDLACIYSGQTRVVEASSVVMTVSRLPNDALYQELTASPDLLREAGINTLKRIGDCHGPSTIAAAVYEGHRFARELGEDTPEICFRREITELEQTFELP